MNIYDAVQIPLPEWAVLSADGEADSENIPLLFRGEVGGRRIAVLTFDLRSSDLPLQVAFPLLMNNLVNWLAPGAGSELPAQAAPGETLTFSTREGANTVDVVYPNQETVQLREDAGRFVFSDTTSLGLYEIKFPGETRNRRKPPLFFGQPLLTAGIKYTTGRQSSRVVFRRWLVSDRWQPGAAGMVANIGAAGAGSPDRRMAGIPQSRAGAPARPPAWLPAWKKPGTH